MGSAAQLAFGGEGSVLLPLTGGKPSVSFPLNERNVYRHHPGFSDLGCCSLGTVGSCLGAGQGPCQARRKLCKTQVRSDA